MEPLQFVSGGEVLSLTADRHKQVGIKWETCWTKREAGHIDLHPDPSIFHILTIAIVFQEVAVNNNSSLTSHLAPKVANLNAFTIQADITA